MKFFLVLSLVLFSLQLCSALDNGLGRTPPMGWNSWNYFGCKIDQPTVQATADAFVTLGLDKLGYTYINLDDCWASSRDANSKQIQPDADRFHDFQGMINYVHGKGLKFGLYSDAGNTTCENRPGSLGYEDIDASTYAKWGVDFLKYDNCDDNGVPPEKRYPVMRDALNKTGRPIYYSVCEWGVDSPATWAPAVGNSWRTTLDIIDTWESVLEHADLNNMWAKYARPGGWNDPDMLEIGNGHMSSTEYETHFSLWCLMKAPLLIGCDVRNIDNDSLRILSNSELIAINQDALGIQANKTKTDGIREVWAGPLSDGGFAVLLLNRGSVDSNVTANWYDFGLDMNTNATVRDLWMMKDLGVMTAAVTATVPSHGAVVYKITPTTE